MLALSPAAGSHKSLVSPWIQLYRARASGLH